MFPNDRPQTLGEEIANAISHGLGAAGALASAPILILAAVRQGDAAFIAGAAVFAATMCLLYLASTIYHALPKSRAKQLFNVLDHSAIYLLIAGTYTPFALGALRGPWGWTLFGLVWGMALLGVGLKASKRLNRPAISTGLYLAMGWLVIIALLASVVSLVYYGRVVKAMYFEAPVKEDRLSTPLGLGSSITLATAALIVLTFLASAVLAMTNPAAFSLLAAIK